MLLCIDRHFSLVLVLQTLFFSTQQEEEEEQNLSMVWFLKHWILWFIGLVAMGVVNGSISRSDMKKIEEINSKGPYLGLVIPNSFEMSPLLQSPSYVADDVLDFSGRRFRIGKLETRKVILVMSGLGMLNSGLVTELLLSLFKVHGVIHFGIAGNANSDLQIGDVVIPKYWAHTGLWNWQRNGDGPEDELAFESNGDYTRKIGYLRFSNYNNATIDGKRSDNYLNRVWYQPEEIFPANGIPEVRQHAFWVPVNKRYFKISRALEGMELGSCVNSTCLPRPAKVVRVKRGCSANVLVDNAAYRNFLNTKFNVTPIDMESAAVALVCHQKRIPFIVFRALSDLAGGGSAESNEAAIFAPLAAQNAVDVILRFVALLFS